jgi:hypothetical protein
MLNLPIYANNFIMKRSRHWAIGNKQETQSKNIFCSHLPGDLIHYLVLPVAYCLLRFAYSPTDALLF